MNSRKVLLPGGLLIDPDHDLRKEVRQIAPRNLMEHICRPPNTKADEIPEAKLEDIYKPLLPDTTRVLHLHERCSDSSIPMCSLHESRFDDPFEYSEEYTAISYTWLDEEYCWYGVTLPASTTIIINNHQVIVPARLALILGVVFEMGVRIVWIDYLSINQLDLKERGKQVAVMHRIFQGAAGTIIFLGKPTQDTDFLFTDDRAWGDLAFKSKREAGILQISKHRYWERAWVLQEMGMSRKLEISCGNIVVESPVFDELTLGLPPGPSDIKHIFHWGILHEYLRGRSIRRHSWSLCDFANRTRHAECTDPRDVLYAKMHLSTDGHKLGEPDYTESVGSLFHRFALQYLKNSRNIHFLKLASGRGNRLGMPTWVIDWDFTQPDVFPFLSKGFEPMLKPQMSRDDGDPYREGRATFSKDGKDLIVLGRVIKKMRPFGKDQPVKPQIKRTARNILSRIWKNLRRFCRRPPTRSEQSLLDVSINESSLVCGDTLICQVYGCFTALVLEWRDGHYVIWDINESDALRAWADEELAEAVIQGCPRTCNFSEFTIR